MVEITLTIQSADGTHQAVLTKDRMTIGRSGCADVQIDDAGLSGIHSSIHRQDERVWVLDENSKNGSYANKKPVPAQGTALANGDEINIGHHTTILVTITDPGANASYEQSKPSSNGPPLALVAGLLLVITALIVSMAFGPRMFKRKETAASRKAKSELEKNEPSAPDKPAENKSDLESINNANSRSDNLRPDNLRSDESGSNTRVSAQRKLYSRMAEDEQNEFIYAQARNISRMMSNREYVFTDDVLPYIKRYVDVYARRVGNNSTAMWGEDLNFLFNRARRLAPDIIREFNARGVPKVVGLYIPMIESEYRECLMSPVGAKGLFQFMAATARGYGVDPDERCNVKKMAPAAARYIKDRMAEFGSDSMSVALAVAGYNRSPDSVRRDLSDVINSKNKERSFWTLIANSDELDRFFQNENIKYVPKFFAAAIIGENPWAFGLQMNPLSTYSEN